MASRVKSSVRRERDSDALEAVKPLVVLVLFGMILYGGYSIVQKGPAPPDASAASLGSDPPPFVPPRVELQSPQPAAVNAAAAPLPPPLAAAAAPGAPPPPAQAVHQPSAAAAQPVTVSAPTAAAPVVTPAPVIVAPGGVPLPEAVGVGGAARTTDTASSPDPPGTPAPSPTYLTAESAPPPTPDAAAVPAALPERYASLPTAPPVAAAALATAAPPTPTSSAGGSAAFAAAWTDAHEKLAAGRYAEALAALSVWYDDPSLGLEESQRLEDLIGQLAGSVIWSQQDTLMPPYVVAAGETLPMVAAPLGISWQILAKINGVADPLQLHPGEHLKVLRGPFDGVVSISRRRLCLQLAGSYAGSFPVVVGRQFLARVGGSVPVVEVRRDAGGPQLVAAPAAARGPAIVLADGLLIEAAEDPGAVDGEPPSGSLVVSGRDLGELIDILGPGSRLLVRQ